MQKRSIPLLIIGIIFVLWGAHPIWNVLAFLDRWVYLGLYSFLPELLAATVRFAAGIAGIFNWKKPKKAKACLALGIVSLAIGIISILFGWLYDPSSIAIEWLQLIIILQVAFIGSHMAYILAAYKFAKSSHDIS